jgi:hypothetical protein
LQIPSVLGHGRAQGAGQKKDDDEGVLFYLLLAANIDRNGWNLTGKGGSGDLFYEIMDGSAAWVTHGHRGGMAARGPGRRQEERRSRRHAGLTRRSRETHVGRGPDGASASG